MAPNEFKLPQAVFIHEQLLIAILPLRWKKIEKKIQKKATLLVAQYHKTKVWTWCLLQPHTTWVQFLVIVLHHDGWLSETWVADVESPRKQQQEKNGRNAHHAHFPLQRLCCRGTNCSMVWKKSATPLLAFPLLHRMNGIRHLYFLCLQFSPSLLPHSIHTACMDLQLYMCLWPHTFDPVQVSSFVKLFSPWPFCGICQCICCPVTADGDSTQSSPAGIITILSVCRQLPFSLLKKYFVHRPSPPPPTPP